MSSSRRAHVQAPEESPTAIPCSRDMVCGVCLEVVFAKENLRERRFGILPNCNHCYCLKCISTWMSVRCLDRKTVKSCPVCRTISPFYIPSNYWVEDTEDKQKLIQKHKDYMATKPCRYFDQGRGTCHFGSRCFYKHVLRDTPVFREGGHLRSRQLWSRQLWGWDSTTSELEEEEEDPFDLTDLLLRVLAIWMLV